MDVKLILAIAAISAALIFYTFGVFRERISGKLTKIHAIIFWLGLLFDSIGTAIMSSIAKSGRLQMANEYTVLLHSITGVLAILLMLFHASWATLVLYKNDVEKRKNFHKFSIVVWLIWLVPYIIGMLIGMTK